MPIGDDDERAAAYLLQASRRQATRQRIEAQLAGDPAAAAAVREHWRPIIERTDLAEVDTEDGINDRSEIIANWNG